MTEYAVRKLTCKYAIRCIHIHLHTFGFPIYHIQMLHSSLIAKYRFFIVCTETFGAEKSWTLTFRIDFIDFFLKR